MAGGVLTVSSNTGPAKPILHELITLTLAPYGGCGISTSRSEAVAIKFATSDYTEEGFVYVIKEDLLEEAGVVVHEFDDPLEPQEKEVTLIESTGGAIPVEVIVEKYEVTSDGQRI